MRSGETDALAALYDRHSCLLYGLAVRILHDESVAEEVLQEAFVQAWISARAYDSKVLTPEGWLIRILRTCGLERLRERNADEVIVQWMGQPPVSDSECDKRLAALPREQRELLECAFFTGATPLAMSKALDLPLQVVNDRIQAGMRNFGPMHSNGQ